MPVRRKLFRELYHGHSKAAVRFQTMWLVFDALLIVFFMVSPFIEKGAVFLIIDYLIAAVLAVDLASRAWAWGSFASWIKRPIVWADFAVLLSLLVPVYAANLGFLRVLRAYSLVNGRSLWRFMKPPMSDYQETIKAIANLVVFIFMMSSLVHTLFAARTSGLNSFMDSLYFTATTLTTTGFGDITLPGFWGRALSVIIMFGGVSLFFRLIQVVMRTPKVRHPCTSCGLQRHESDAVHCKACGATLNIRHEND